MTSRKLPPALQVSPPSGASFEVLLNGVRLTIGRSSRNDLCLNDPFVSRLHAEIRRDGEEFVLHDSGSANGTYHNGQRIESSALLRLGDVIRVGETELRVADVTTSASGGYPTPPAFRFAKRDQAAPTEMLNLEQATPLVLDLPPAAPLMITPLPKSESQSPRNWLALLRQVSETLLVNQSLEEALNTIVSLACTAIPAERAYLWLSDNQGRLQTQAYCVTESAAHREVTLPWLVYERVVTWRAPVIVADTQQDEQIRGETRALSLLAAPLIGSSEVLGILYLDSLCTPNCFHQDDLELLTTLARVAAVKVENSRLLEARLEHRRFEDELKVASEIQLRLHPAHPPRLEGYELAGLSFPCREIGGDYYDFIPRGDGKLLIAVGDVAGKGMGAALMMSSVHAALRTQAQTGRSLPELVAAVNDYVVENSPENKFLTLFCAELNPMTGTLHYTNAGHDPAVLVRATGDCVMLPAQGIPLGIIPGLMPDVGYEQLGFGDVLVIYTDGLTESLNEQGAIFGLERLVETLVKYRELSAVRLRERVDEAIGRFVGRASTADDLTLVLLRRRPQ